MQERWYIERCSVLGWRVFYPTKGGVVWLQPNDHGRLRAIHSRVNWQIDFARAKQCVELARSSFGSKRFGNAFAEDRRRLCQKVCELLNTANVRPSRAEQTARRA